jgi:hypothetical protein
MSCQPGNHRLARIQKRRSLSLSRGRNWRRRSTSNCCRRHKFSATNDALDLQQVAIAHPHHGNIGPSGHHLAKRRLAVIFRQAEQDCRQFCALQAKERQDELAKVFAATTIGVREARAKRLNATRRPAFLLSGLLICGCCQGRYGIILKDRYGCLNHHRRGTCDNGHTIRRPIIEQRVLSGLTDRLVSPEAVAEAVRAYHEEMNRQNQGRRAQTDANRQGLPKIERAINGIMAAIEDGMYQPAMKARMAELERQKAEIEARLNEARPDLPDVNPNVASIPLGQKTETARRRWVIYSLPLDGNSAEAHPIARGTVAALVVDVCIAREQQDITGIEIGRATL